MTSFMIKHNVEDYIKELRDKADIFAILRLPCKQIPYSKKQNSSRNFQSKAIN